MRLSDFNTVAAFTLFPVSGLVFDLVGVPATVLSVPVLLWFAGCIVACYVRNMERARE